MEIFQSIQSNKTLYIQKIGIKDNRSKFYSAEF
jgi:hypothetical protein